MRDRLIELLDEKLNFEFLSHQIEALADHLLANGVTVQEWISVKDRMPKGGAIVLCNTDYFVEVLQWDERADMWVDQYRSYRKNYVTHWMPLPPPPKGE